MSTIDLEELEEGEIAGSDSAEEYEKISKVKCSGDGGSAHQNHSVFSSIPTHLLTTAPAFRLHYSSESHSDSDEEVWKKRKCYQRDSSCNSGVKEQFVNPNYMKNGGMPPLPVTRKKDVWGSVLQEQILTQEVGGFCMEKRIQSDRDVESYDYTRATEDNRPPLELEVMEAKSKSDDLFSEVIDLEEVLHKPKAQKRQRPVKERLSDKVNEERPRRNRHRVTSSSSVEEVTYAVTKALKEKKMHLIRRVVQVVGQAKALDLLQQTEDKEATGGMLTMNGSRRRTAGGVYLQLLKQDPDVTKEQTDKIFEEENRWFLENKKRKKIRARQRKREQQMQLAGTRELSVVKTRQVGVESVPTDCPEDEAYAGADGDSGEEEVDTSRNHSDDEHSSDSNASFSKELQSRIKQQAQLRNISNEGAAVCDDDLKEDILDIVAEEEIID